MLKKIIAFLFVICWGYWCSGQLKDSTWKHYVVGAVGIDLPGFFTTVTTNEYSTIFHNNVDKNISLSIEAYKASPKFKAADLESYYGDNLHFFDKVTYEYKKDNFFVMTGFDKQGDILYIKGIKQGDSYFELDLSYNKKYQYLFDKTLGKISASFK